MRMRTRVTLTSLCIITSAIAFAGACSTRPDRETTKNNGTGGSGGANSGGGGTNAGTAGTGGGPPVTADDATCTSYESPRFVKLSPIESAAQTKLQGLTPDEKIRMLSNSNCTSGACFETSDVPGKVPAFKMTDGPRGIRGGDSIPYATTFAVSEARAAAFDLDLEERIGKIIGAEAAALHWDIVLAPTINVLRHPAWARAQETYGEDPVLQGEMGAAFVRGIQNTVPACVKHYAGNNTDENRTTVNANADEQTWRENYLRNFQIVIEKSDPACVMAAYNQVNGTYATQNKHLLIDVLRTDWKWTGFTVSDWQATKGDGTAVFNGGLDIEMDRNRAFIELAGALQSGGITGQRLDEAALRVLNARAKFGQLEAGFRSGSPNTNAWNNEESKKTARESAEKGAVLLKNDGILPLGPKATEVGSGTPSPKKIVVLGPDRDLPSNALDVIRPGAGGDGVHGLGDRGSSEVRPGYAISYLDGITERASGITVTGGTSPNDAAGADVVIIPVTMGHKDEGEAFNGGGDRSTLTLSGEHPLHWGSQKPSAFIKAVAAVNPNVVVLLAVGSAIIVEDWIDDVKAVVQTFYPGQEGGAAVANLLFGDINFSGKLPFTVGTSESQYPDFDNTASNVTFDYLHGYRKFEQESLTPRYWFGYGSSYTTYEYSGVKVLCSSVSETGRLNLEVTVKNTGKMAGEEVVQVYIKPPAAGGIRRAPKELKAFTRVPLDPGESKTVQLYVPARDMAYWSGEEDGEWVVEKGEYTVLVGPSAEPTKLLPAKFTIN